MRELQERLKTGASNQIGGSKRKTELCVFFAIKQGLDDKQKDGENSKDFSREVKNQKNILLT